MNIGKKIRRELTSSGGSFTSFQMVHTHTLSLLSLTTHSHTHSLSLTHRQAWDNLHCHRVGCTPCVPLASLWRALGSAAFAWQAWDNLHCQGSDVRPGVPLAFLGLRCFCVAGVGQSPLPGGRMYALASLWRSSGGAFSIRRKGLSVIIV